MHLCKRPLVFGHLVGDAVERLRYRIKYEEVYLKAYKSIPEARASLAKYFDFTNHDRRHQGLMDRQAPWQAYAGVSLGQAA